MLNTLSTLKNVRSINRVISRQGPGGCSTLHTFGAVLTDGGEIGCISRITHARTRDGRLEGRIQATGKWKPIAYAFADSATHISRALEGRA